MDPLFDSVTAGDTEIERNYFSFRRSKESLNKSLYPRSTCSIYLSQTRKWKVNQSTEILVLLFSECMPFLKYRIPLSVREALTSSTFMCLSFITPTP
jgi:hypothetical protein